MAGPGGRPLWLRLLVILAVLVAVLGFADQVFRIVVQRQVSAALSTALRAEPAVEVELHDWPFATSVLSNRLESAILRADTAVLPAKSAQLPVQDISVQARGISPVRDLEHGFVEYATVSGRATWADLSELLGVTVASGGGDRVDVSAVVTVLDQPISVSVSGVPSVDPSTARISLADARASFGGVQVPDQITRTAIAQASTMMKLPTEAGMRWESLSAAADGARVHVSFTDLDLSQFQ